ncbi:MAG: DUF3226 domain-containing protein [Candidatus Parabeggiatoa sp.]|nr:DUF3226 domain-containing protein [Candidatus Parabeggiatoa sp.]
MALIQKLLIVEGIDDKYVISRLLQRRKITYKAFEIRDANGIRQSLNTFSIAIKSGNYEVIGIVVDADTDLSERWQDLKNLLIKEGYQSIPQNPHPKGIIITDPEEELPTVGIWLMPNNEKTGMLEDFIRFLVPEGDELLPIAQNQINELINAGQNRFTQTHKSKAIIHTWLAWQERPGTQLGKAMTYRFIKSQEYILDDGKASHFINWLQTLFKE